MNTIFLSLPRSPARYLGRRSMRQWGLRSVTAGGRGSRLTRLSVARSALRKWRIAPGFRIPAPVTALWAACRAGSRPVRAHPPHARGIYNATAQDTSDSRLLRTSSQQANGTPVFWPGNASAVSYYITVDNRSSLGGVTTARSKMWPARAAKSEKAPKGTLGVPTLYHMPPSAHAPLCAPSQGSSG